MGRCDSSLANKANPKNGVLMFRPTGLAHLSLRFIVPIVAASSTLVAGACSGDGPVSAVAPSPAARASGGSTIGGGGGGGAGGGGGTVAPTPTAAPCATIESFNVKAGYRPSSNGTMGAVWTGFTVKNCSAIDETIIAQVNETINSKYAYSVGAMATLTPGQALSPGTYDNDFAELNTSYLVTLTVTEKYTGAVLATRSVTVTTPLLLPAP